MLIKVWITRSSAGSLMAGGLERCQVWFRKPDFIWKSLLPSHRDTPFGNLHESETGCRRYGWECDDVGSYQFSFGKVFGYPSEGGRDHIGRYVWQKLITHF